MKNKYTLFILEVGFLKITEEKDIKLEIQFIFFL